MLGYLLEENEVFGAIWRLFDSFAGNREGFDYRVRASTDSYQEYWIDGRLLPSIDGKATRELMTKLEDCKFQKVSSITF